MATLTGTMIVTCTAQTFQILPSVLRSVTLASVAEGESGAAIMGVPFVAALGAVATTESGDAETAVLRSVALAATAEGESGAAVVAQLVATTLDAVAETESADALRTEIITGLLRLLVTAGRPSIQVR